MPSQVKTIQIFCREDNHLAVAWRKKIIKWLKHRHKTVKIVSQKPDAAIVLGGDGAILEAARLYKKSKTVILGLNLGQVGFLASVREPKKFLPSLARFLKGDYRTVRRMMLTATVLRRKKKVYKTDALNEITVQNPLGMLEIGVEIEKHQFQHIRGSGVLVATATGSTAYNLSAHGPIVTPNIRGIVLTELLDHNIPTPSIVLPDNEKVFLKILGFRKHGLLSMTETGKPIDVLLISDGENIFPLESGDTVIVERSPNLVAFAELQKNYFFRSLQEKFSFQ